MQRSDQAAAWRAFRRCVHNVLGHKTLISVSGDFNHVWHHADLRMIFARCTRSRAVRRIKALRRDHLSLPYSNFEYSRSWCYCRRQVCQRALMIEHLHLDFVMNSCAVSLSHSTAINFSGSSGSHGCYGRIHGGSPDLYRGDVGDNRVARNWAAAFRKGDRTPSAPLMGRCP